MCLASQFSEDLVVGGNNGSVGPFGVSGAAVRAKHERSVRAQRIKELIEVREGQELIEVREGQILDKIFVPVRQQGDIVFKGIRGWGFDSGCDSNDFANEKRLWTGGDIDRGAVAW
jgi:hypothetical protein